MKQLQLFTCLWLFVTLKTFGQLSLPPNGENQKSVARQYIGPIAYVEITYNSPDVAGREGAIWGKVVQYGMFNQDFAASSADNPSPWRAGANENTTIEFSHDVNFHGKPVAAGKYSLHMIARENEDWTIILNKETRAWGSYFYEPHLDVVRVTTNAEEAPFHEYLSYEFIKREPDAATAALFWENLMVPFTIEVPENDKIILATLESELKSYQTFESVNWSSAALWASSKGFEDIARKWVDVSISDPSMGEYNFYNVNAKVRILLQNGDGEEALELAKKLVGESFVNARQAHGVGGSFVRNEDMKSAFEIFKLNHKRFKGAWPTAIGLARGYSSQGDYKNAIKYLESAKKTVPNQNEGTIAYIDSMIEKAKKEEDIN